MAQKKTNTLTVTFTVEHSGGPKVSTYEYLAELISTEWEGTEVYFQDAAKDDETSVRLYVKDVEIRAEAKQDAVA
jgi:hypothetical protein